MITHYNIITRAALIICMIFAANFTTHAQEDISDDEVVTDSLLNDTLTTSQHALPWTEQVRTHINRLGAHSSMDRILDSGSNDWSSNLHGRTQH